MEHDERKETTKSEPKKGASNPTLRSFLLGGVAALAVLGLGTLAVMTAGIYKFGWSGPAAGAIARALPYPVALVNSNVIRYSEYLDDIATLRHFYDKQADQIAAQGGTLPSEEEIRQNVMDRLVRNEVLAEEALRYNVSVSDEDIDAEFERLVGQAGDAATVEKDIEDLYGWTVEKFREKVLMPYLLEQKLAEAVGKDDALNAEAENRAKEVLAKVQAGDDFAELAKTYSSDFASGQNGGDLGWFEKGLMVPEFEAAAWSLGKGEVSDLVRTQFGFHIIRVDDIEEEDGERVRVSARHILIPAASVQQYLDDAVGKASVKKLIEI